MVLYDLHPDAKIGKNVTISNFCTIENDVVIGDGTWIGPNVTIFAGARIGKNCKIFPGSVIAAIPQDLKFSGEYTTVEIGDNNVIRECCTINRGTSASGKTVIGNNNLLMAYVHVAHDCVVGNNCVFANNTTLAGHILVGDWTVLGGKTAILQFVHIGQHVITSGGSLVDKDIPPFVKAARYPISYAGINSLGLHRRGFSQQSIENIQCIYRLLYQKGYSIRHAVELIKEQYGNTDEGKVVLSFIGQSTTGLMKGYAFMNRQGAAGKSTSEPEEEKPF
ncbi:MAG: acyl-ACP--UDP-N-acetylglucosamine O-acyltransferase [Bacteroidales bacterium]|nr:acyl-ACP--UDP-N-acetylglucosamine O-acyltransferase [Bacteroidales bacterium]